MYFIDFFGPCLRLFYSGQESVLFDRLTFSRADISETQVYKIRDAK